MTNADLIVRTLKRAPGLDDDELSRKSGVAPRQTVNQICRHLESKGLIRRVVGQRGKIVSYLIGNIESSELHRTRVKQSPSTPRSARAKSTGIKSGKPIPDAACIIPNRRKTLIIIPCSGAKVLVPNGKVTGRSILNDLPPDLKRKLREARHSIASRAQLDERKLVPAWQRYHGSLYQAARDELGKYLNGGNGHIMVVSGGYGLVLAGEPVGIYNAMFKKSWWPRGLLEEVLLDYAKKHHVKHVRAFASMTTEYGKLIKGVRWGAAGIEDAWLLAPEPALGAMVKSPRAQGQALAAMLRGELTNRWTSSDGLCLHAIPLTE